MSMTERPETLPDRPNGAGADPLSEALRAIHFTRAVYYTVDAARPWPAIQVPAGIELAAGLGSHTRTVLSYHVIVEGGCWTGLEAPDGARMLPIALERGDVVVYPRGDPYGCAWPPTGSAGPRRR
jgi:hypothetical protein